jgi:hypothetical protein
MKMEFKEERLELTVNQMIQVIKDVSDKLADGLYS